MDDLIEKILKIEDRAQEIVASARNDRSNLEKDLSDKAEMLEKEIKEKEKAKIAYLTDFENKESEKKIEEIEKKLIEQKKLLDEKYENKHEMWVQNIFESIII